ncbi:MAG: ABC transporter substrate-binding protein [Acidiphilium sp.]|nr:ABC transporter substrate-binding protein [Acidiphilium sp.]MDD4936182.1 ABC transporter substrate-binding protein [Acidiphilium sp.]
MKRRILLAAPLLAVLPLAIPPARAAAPEAEPVIALDDALIAVMKAGSAGQPFTARYDMLKPVVEQSFDLSTILQVSAGLFWAEIPAAQQTQLQTLFRQYTIATYVSSFNAYDGQSFETLPGIRTVGTKRVVTTDLIAKSGRKTPLAYVMTPTAGTWKITDVLFDGTISKVATQRSEFSSLIEPNDASRLIDALMQKIAALSGGAIKG